jgi:hypothetical protein
MSLLRAVISLTGRADAGPMTGTRAKVPVAS